MRDYKSLYEKGISQIELDELKKSIIKGDLGTSWQDYYWGAKCICTYDSDDFDPAVLSKAINKSLKYGLSFRVNKSMYLDAIKILASVYSQMAQYELVLNCLGSVIELDPEAPDWVFHDFVTAQNRTDNIKRNLRKPGMFLEDLSRNDASSEEIRKKQSNIFKEFLAGSIIFLVNNPNAEVAMDELRQAAIIYGVIDTREWNTFEDACKGKVSPTTINVVKQVEEKPAIEPVSFSKPKPRPQTIPREARPLVISLFPEDNNPKTDTDEEMAKKYSELLEMLNATKKELDKKTKELTAAGSTLAQLSDANDGLRSSIEKYQADMSDYETAISEKEEEIKRIQDRLSHVQKGTEEQKVLQRQVAEAKKQQEEMSSKYEGLRAALDDSEKKLKSAGEQLESRIRENRALKEELDKIRKEGSHLLAGNKAAEIKGRYTTYIYITTDCLAKWLSKRLTKYNGWWENCVISVLSNDQVLYATENHYSSLEEFDLAALLRIMKKNWNRLSSYSFMPHSSRNCLDQMFDVRNRWAHFNTTPPSKEEMVNDLSIICEFLSFLNCDSATQKEVARFAVEIGKMTF